MAVGDPEIGAFRLQEYRGSLPERLCRPLEKGDHHIRTAIAFVDAFVEHECTLATLVG